jgi:hypothetical protein
MKNDRPKMTKMNTSREMKNLPVSLSRDSSEANRLFGELVLLSWLAQQKHERRRLMMASLESLLDSSSASEWSTGGMAVLLRGRDLGSKRDRADRRDKSR